MPAARSKSAHLISRMQKDYFSTQSESYKLYRPEYPDKLFTFLTEHLPSDAVIWDCATGSGQAAVALRRYAGTIVASDQSRAQLANAPRENSVHYVQALAEAMLLASHTIDLVTIAQALHWFDFERFYAEVRRVLKPTGRIAAWTYSFLSVPPQLGADIDAAVRWFYNDMIGPYWPIERRWVDDHYRSIPFPFSDLDTPSFVIEVDWDLRATLGYIGSWSAVQRYKDAESIDPVELLAARILPLWGEETSVRRLRWNLALRLGRLA